MNSGKIFSVWLLAVRPKTLGAAVAPILIGTAMAYAVDKGHAVAALAALLGALLIQIGTNFSNDYFDFVKGADTEERLGPIRATQAGLVTPEAMRRNFVVVFGLAVLVGIYLVYRGGWPIVIIGVLSIASGILYTGGPMPLGYLGLGDLFVLIFFGPVAVGGTFYVQTLELPLEVILAGFGPGLLATALLAVNNLRDEPTDKKVGKRTLAVRFGPAFARGEFLTAFALALILPFILAFWTNGHWFACLSALIIIPGRSPIRQIISGVEGVELNETLAATGKLIILYSILFSFGWWIG
ncbi:MAG TPA: 1,4-dihydroxy-2-naphthoate polyprenyltransferase [Deltaproteobacteria bacterium]|jgi:1,4-dihydroxy-2-naphthoate octaprenyltransferase|nr:1,4-dihydroxy-2-naphthoate polyprenyltransferase [SAR324 cluster bacterium]MCH2265783.1 1,4-dihydroxy-2-naphthoate polyprenyltransferase [SAR324 cluster bacterium]HIN46909.1 1,4-dihydroxy-2-naphthoate polyprenyltransferase [Deltaproteobacteria bacterium]